MDGPFTRTLCGIGKETIFWKKCICCNNFFQSNSTEKNLDLGRSIFICCRFNKETLILNLKSKTRNIPNNLYIVHIISDKNVQTWLSLVFAWNQSLLGKLKKSKSWELFTIGLLNDTDNIAQLEGIWAKLAVLYSREIWFLIWILQFIRFENNWYP